MQNKTNTERNYTMKEKEIIWQSKVKADIFSPEFYEQLGLEDAELPSTEQPFYYTLDIEVSVLNALVDEKVRSYDFRERSIRNSLNPKDIFGSILSDQISTVYKIFKHLGYQFSDVSICAEPLEELNSVTITLSKGKAKEYDKNGKLKEIMIVISTIPYGPGFRKNIERFVMEGCIALEREYHQKQMSLPEPPVQLISFHELLAAVADGIAANSDNEEHSTSILNDLIESCHLKKERPLRIEGRCGRVESSDDPGTTVKVPEWMLYSERDNGMWSISEHRSGTDVQYELIDDWKRKTTRIAIPFHNLKPVKYSVLAKQAHGYTKIANAEGQRYSTLQIMWDEKIE